MGKDSNKSGARGSVIAPCSCKHEFQDKTYGRGNRVKNNTSQTGKVSGKPRCTVCGQAN